MDPELERRHGQGVPHTPHRNLRKELKEPRLERRKEPRMTKTKTKARPYCPHRLRTWLLTPTTGYKDPTKPYHTRYIERDLPCTINYPHEIHQNGGHRWR